MAAPTNLAGGVDTTVLDRMKEMQDANFKQQMAIQELTTSDNMRTQGLNAVAAVVKKNNDDTNEKIRDLKG